MGDHTKVLMSWLPGFGCDVEIPLSKGQDGVGDDPSTKWQVGVRTMDLQKDIGVHSRKRTTCRERKWHKAHVGSYL